MFYNYGMRIFLFITMTVILSVQCLSQVELLFNYYNAHSKLNQFNGNVLIAENDKIILKQSFNNNDLDSIYRVNLNTKFIIASVSKVFVKLAILRLAQQNKLKLDDTISKFIPSFPKGNLITIEHLMLHKSGLPRELVYADSIVPIPLCRIIALAFNEKLMFEPGANVSYSNVGYFLLHYIISKAAGMDYFHFMQKEIFAKLKLKNTFEYNFISSKKNFVKGFSNENGQTQSSETNSINQFETGNIITTLNDLYALSRIFFSSKFLSNKSIEFLFQHDSILIQAGGRPGYRSYFYVDLKSKTTFLLLSNQSNIPFEEIIDETRNIKEGRPYKYPQLTNRIECKIDTDLLRKYQGVYFSKEHNLHFTIKLIEDHLVILEPNNSQTLLMAEAENCFFDNPHSKDTYSFILDDLNLTIGFLIMTDNAKVIMYKLIDGEIK